MINIRHFDPNLLSLDKISFKSIDAVIYNIKYITLRSPNHVNIDNENPPCLISNNADGYSEESNGNKYLAFASRDKNLLLQIKKKEVLRKYRELWDEIKDQIKTINGGEPIEYKKIL